MSDKEMIPVPAQPQPEPPRVDVPQTKKPEPEKAETPKLIDLLKFYPDLAAELYKALLTGRFMVTVHCQKKVEGQAGDLQHYLFENGYPQNDIVQSLGHIATTHNAKMNPNADTKGAAGWI